MPLRSLVVQHVPRPVLVALDRHPGLTRVLRRAGARAVPEGTHDVVLPAGPCAGARMTIDFTYNERFLWLGTYEPWVAATLTRVLTADSVVWDVGANIGSSLLFASRHSARRHLGIEADPANLARLERHVRDNGVDAELLHAAVAAVPGRVRIDASANASLTRVVPAAHPGDGQANGAPVVEVEAVTLDGLLEGRTPPTLVLMDIEGAETDALRGAHRLLHEIRPTWLVELHPGPGADAHRILKDAGYDLEVANRKTPVEVQLRTHRVHVLATPR